MAPRIRSKPLKRIIAILITALTSLAGCIAAAQQNTPPAPPASAPLITYVANDGFLIEHAGKKVLVDALFDVGVASYLAPSPELLAQLAEARGPFAGVDLLLVTHVHADHFSAKVVAAHMLHNPHCRLIAHSQVTDRLRSEDGFAQIRSRIHEVSLEPGARERVNLNGIAVDVLSLCHAPYLTDGQDRHKNVRNLAFLFNLGGTGLFHLGDASIGNSAAHLGAFPFDKIPVDLLFLNGHDRFLPTREFIGRKIKPGRIIAMHVQPAELAEDLKGIWEAYPSAVVFRQSMEQRSLPVEIDFRRLTSDYFGLPSPGATPQVFARGIVSSPFQEHGAPAFSPDGNTVFWTTNRRPGPDNDKWLDTYLTMRRENGRWSAPWVPAFGAMLVFSPDGRRAFFSRPPRRGAQDDIWVAERQADNWSDPKCLNFVARYPEMRFAAMPTVARSGALYFVSRAPGVQSEIGIYRAALVNGEYGKPELLPPSINRPPFLNWTPFIAPDESYLLFSSNRTGSLDKWGDLYISRRSVDGTWSEPVSLGEPVNSKLQERIPAVSPDGKYLFFTRDTPGYDEDVYWVTTASIPALRP